MSDINQALEHVIKNELRKGNLSDSMEEILKYLPSICSLYEVDIDAIRKRITNHQNPMNNFLRLFGLRLVRQDSLEIIGNGSGNLKKDLTFDQSGMRNAISIYAGKLRKLESEYKTRNKELVEKVNALNAETARLNDSLSQERGNADAMRENIARSLQDTLSRMDKSDDTEALQSVEDLLKDLGYHILWTPDDERDNRFFFQKTSALKRENTLKKMDDKNIYVSKPVLISDNSKEIIKGYAYLLAPLEE